MNNKFISEEIIAAIYEVTNFFKSNKKLSLHEPYFEDTKSWEYVKDFIDSGWVSSAGSWIYKFEKAICEYTKSKYAIAVTNGTVALRLALSVVGVKSND